MSTDPNAIFASLRAMGRVFNPQVLDATYRLFAPLHRPAEEQGLRVLRDIAYGPDAAQRLDLFLPAETPRKALPVVAYFHGGGFVAGSRSPVPGLIYDNVAAFFARHGCIGVNATYRLAPAHRWPSGAEDVGAVFAWLRAHVAAEGGDPQRLYAMGQSAGGSHVAAYALMPTLRAGAPHGLAGAILLSGTCGPPVGRAPGANHLAYYGEDVARWPEMDPLAALGPDQPPLFLAIAELDPYSLAGPTIALLDRLLARGLAVPRFRILAGHNHVSSAMQIGSAVDGLGPDLLDFVGEAPAIASVANCATALPKIDKARRGSTI